MDYRGHEQIAKSYPLFTNSQEYTAQSTIVTIIKNVG